MANATTNSVADGKVRLPLSFIKNHGQEDARAYFTMSHKCRRLFFSSNRITMVELEPIEEDADSRRHIERSYEPRNGVALELSFPGGNSGLRPEGVLEQGGRYDYFRGGDQPNGEQVFRITPRFAIPPYGRVWTWSFPAVKPVLR